MVEQQSYMEIFESRARWIRAFNRLEKAVTNHIDNCIDADDLAYAHKAVMREVGPSRFRGVLSPEWGPDHPSYDEMGQ